MILVNCVVKIIYGSEWLIEYIIKNEFEDLDDDGKKIKNYKNGILIKGGIEKYGKNDRTIKK